MLPGEISGVDVQVGALAGVAGQAGIGRMRPPQLLQREIDLALERRDLEPLALRLGCNLLWAVSGVGLRQRVLLLYSGAALAGCNLRYPLLLNEPTVNAAAGCPPPSLSEARPSRSSSASCASCTPHARWGQSASTRGMGRQLNVLQERRVST